MPSFEEARKVMNIALDRTNGVMLKFPTKKSATDFRSRCYQVRHRDREDTRKLYAMGEPGHGVSAFDSLQIELKEVGDEWQLVITTGMAILDRLFDPATGAPIKEEESTSVTVRLSDD